MLVQVIPSNGIRPIEPSLDGVESVPQVLILCIDGVQLGL